MCFKNSPTVLVYAAVIAGFVLSGCESTKVSDDSANRIRAQIDAYMRQSERRPDQAFIGQGPLTVVADRISHLNSNFDRTDKRNYYVYPCTEASGATGLCVYYTDANGQRIPNSEPIHRLNYYGSEIYGPYFQIDQCAVVSGLTKTCAPDDGKVSLVANGSGYSGSIFTTSLVTWYQDQAGAARSAAIREIMLPHLLDGRITRQQVRQQNQQMFDVVGSVIDGLVSGAAAARAGSSSPARAGASSSSQDGASGYDCPMKSEGTSNQAYNDYLGTLISSTGDTWYGACRINTAQNQHLVNDRDIKSIQ
ncbi:hypothetical protein [uncultured Albimonas sp.]|uniref:hypothetical protein n=1 Tax=uncultured Albimonas sp. TaxID=1331701 RepID=UPI0030EB1B51